MALASGTRRLGPDNASLQVNTFREGVAARVGHDLILDVTRWEATFDLDGSTVELSADPRSLAVRDGRHGAKPLTDKDRAAIRKNIDEKVLRGWPISFRSSSARLVDQRLVVEGELTIGSSTRPLTVRLDVGDDGEFGGTIPLTQTEWGITPYRGLMGALKVRDEVEIVFRG
jgi:polyisoprenoid-binding protein YceI